MHKKVSHCFITTMLALRLIYMSVTIMQTSLAVKGAPFAPSRSCWYMQRLKMRARVGQTKVSRLLMLSI